MNCLWARRKSGIRVKVALVVLLSVVVIVLLSSILTTYISLTSNTRLNWRSDIVPQRHLLSISSYETLNCTPAAIEQYPKPVFSQEQRLDGAVTVYIIAAVYMFLGLAVICDSYFVPSLEIICDMLKISADVGGATFMAAGSSAPELATAVIAVFISEDDIGVGTVVGSAVYNVTFVISICGLFAGMVVYLHWWPLLRDCLVYTLSIVALILIILDGYINWWEAAALLVMYMLYIALMAFNKRLEKWMLAHVTCCPHHLERTHTYHKISMENSDSPNHGQNGFISSDQIKRDSSADKVTFDLPKDSPTEETADKYMYYEMACNNNHPKTANESDSDCDLYTSVPHTALLSNKQKEETVLKFPQNRWARLLWVVSLPITLVLYITIPDCRLRRWRKWFVMTFIISLVWLSAFSYVIVWMITVIGFTFGIPDTIMGLTFIAFGVSVPDAIASFIVVREGEGDMAVSNAVGSNIFDILICLGIPWFLKTAITDPGNPVPVRSSGLLYSSITLLSTVVILIGVTHLNKWKLDKRHGAILMVMYVVVTILSALYEFNFFGISEIPGCPSDY